MKPGHIVLVIDNGESWGEHAVYYVQIPEGDRADYEETLALVEPASHVLFVATGVEWVTDEPDDSVPFPIGMFCDAWDWDGEGKLRGPWNRVPKGYREKLMADWERSHAEFILKNRDSSYVPNWQERHDRQMAALRRAHEDEET